MSCLWDFLPETGLTGAVLRKLEWPLLPPQDGRGSPERTGGVPGLRPGVSPRFIALSLCETWASYLASPVPLFFSITGDKCICLGRTGDVIHAKA